jgi:hypothetical protein
LFFAPAMYFAKVRKCAYVFVGPLFI